MSLIRTKHIQHFSPAERALYKWINQKYKSKCIGIRLLANPIEGIGLTYYYQIENNAYTK
jgi:hypothetical protein